MPKIQKKPLSAAIAIALGACVASPAMADVGPSTQVTPYLTGVAPGVQFTSVLTVGDSVRKKHKGDATYRMVGIPDGLGAYDNGDGTITVLMNHELQGTAGVPRAHGATGAFISKWQIRKSDLKVLNGEDLINTVYLWDAALGKYVQSANAVFNRFCSADLPSKSAFFNSRTGRGFSDGYIFMNGEEAGPTGRAFAHVVQGRGNSATYELPALGRFSWENAVASPYRQDKTIVAGLDDGSIGSSKAYFYVGTKQRKGNPVEEAGLTNGINYQVVIPGASTESDIPQGDTDSRTFELATSGGLGFNRVEDGAWDPDNRNVFYFVTTASFTTNSRLWEVTFDDIRQPEAGGTIRVLVDGALRGPKMMDNITVDGDGKVIIQEDPGNQAYLAKVWSYDPATDELTELAQFDPARFTPPPAGTVDPNFITQDEESSGVLEVTALLSDHDDRGRGRHDDEDNEGYDTDSYRYFILDAQVHKNIAATEPELVEMGQLLFMAVPK